MNINRVNKFFVDSPNNTLFVFTGESNTGGIALNSDATAFELTSTSNIKILNNTTLTSFDDLHIGVNNLVGHAGLGAPYNTTTHSWELQMINRVSAGTFNKIPTYIVKAGQGGTKIADWYVGATTYLSTNCWQILQDRVDAAISIMHPSRIVFFYQQVLNDTGGTDQTTWMNDTIAHFAKIRVKYPNSVIIFLEPMTTYSSWYHYIESAVAASQPNTYFVSSIGATYNALHYDYAGQKTNSNTFMNKCISLGLVGGTIV